MTSHQGKVHSYLCMTLNYTEAYTVKAIMIDYIYETIAAFDKEDPIRHGVKNSAAPEDL